MRLLVALDVVRLVLVPVVVRRRLALRRRQVGPNAGRVRSVSLANLVLDRPGHLDRPPDVLRLNELRFLGDRDVARGSDEAAELPEPQAQPLVLVVQRLCTPSGLVARVPDRIARRGRNALVDRNLLRDELHELRAVDVGVRHRRLDEHLVSGTRDPRAQRRQDVRQVLDVARADEDEVARNALTFTLAPALCGFLPEIGNRFSCIAVRMNRWRKPNCGSSSMNRTPWWASWIAPATTRSYGWVPSCGWPPYGSCRTSPRSSVSLAPVASTNGLRAIGTRTFRGLSFSTSRRFSSAFWSRTRIMSPARSYTTTSSLPNCCRVVVTRSRPWSCANVTSKMPPSRSPNGFPTFAWDAALGRPHFGHMRSVGEEYVPQWTHL